MSISKCRVISLNVRGLHDDGKRNKLFAWLNDRKSDIIFLQETFCTDKIEDKVNFSWDGNIYHSLTNSNHSRGVSILFSKDFKHEVVNCVQSDDGRKLLVNIKYDDICFTLVSVYAPNEENVRNLFFQNLSKWIRKHATSLENVILGGTVA